MNISEQEMYVTRSAKLDSLKKSRLVSIPDSASATPLYPSFIQNNTEAEHKTKAHLTQHKICMVCLLSACVQHEPFNTEKKLELMYDINKYQTKLHRITGSLSENSTTPWAGGSQALGGQHYST